MCVLFTSFATTYNTEIKDQENKRQREEEEQETN